MRRGGGAVTFSSDGSALAVVVGKQISLWDHRGATLLHTVATVDRVSDQGFYRTRWGV